MTKRCGCFLLPRKNDGWKWKAWQLFPNLFCECSISSFIVTCRCSGSIFLWSSCFCLDLDSLLQFRHIQIFRVEKIVETISIKWQIRTQQPLRWANWLFGQSPLQRNVFSWSEPARTACHSKFCQSSADFDSVVQNSWCFCCKRTIWQRFAWHWFWSANQIWFANGIIGGNQKTSSSWTDSQCCFLFWIRGSKI